MPILPEKVKYFDHFSVKTAKFALFCSLFRYKSKHLTGKSNSGKGEGKR